VVSVCAPTVTRMTSPSRTSSTRWLLLATAESARCDSPAWEEQINLLRSVAAFNSATEVWQARIGSFDAEALSVLQTLYDAARQFGTQVHLEPVVAPAKWQGPVFEDNTELAQIAAASRDQERPLGQLPVS
jgi:hypothetical protein